MLIEKNGVLGVECDGRFVPAISGGVVWVALAAVIVTIAVAAVQYTQQQAQAEAQYKYQKGLVEAQDEAVKQNAALANDAYNRQVAASQAKQAQVDVSSEFDNQGVATQAAQARATAKVAAGEAGVSGLSVNALIDDFTRQEAQYRYASKVSGDYQRDQTRAELEGLRSEAEGRIQTMKPYQAQPLQFPSLAGAALRAGSDSLSAYNRYSAGGSGWPGSGGSGYGVGPAAGQTSRAYTP